RGPHDRGLRLRRPRLLQVRRRDRLLVTNPPRLPPPRRATPTPSGQSVVEGATMSEAAPEGGNTSGETPAADEFKPITSQDELNRIIGERVKRAKPADYDDLKSKAAKLDEIEQANQTEAEKAAKRLAELEAELNDTRRDSMRLKIATEH